MRFWDSSALVPLLAAEARTRAVQAMYLRDPDAVVWWGTPVECASAIARLERDSALSAAEAAESFARLDALAPSWMQIDPSDEIRESARRFLRVHPLRAADALQLAAGLIAAERRPSTLTFVTFDDRLRQAAAKEGFRFDDLESAAL
jgi:predicted nucleic acid-binding protein